MENRRVFVSSEMPPSRADRDFSSAHRYGTLHFVLSAFPSASQAPGPAMMQAAKKLRDFNPDLDYLVYVGGDPLAMGICLLVLKDMVIPEITILRWERERGLDGAKTGTGYYVPQQLPLRMGGRISSGQKGVEPLEY